MKRIRFGHIHADYVSMECAVDMIETLVRRGAGGYVVTPNVDHVVLAENSQPLRAAYAAASLSLVDGMPLVWASRLFGHPLPGKISGSDLVDPLLKRAAERGMRVYFLGAAPGVGITAAENATRKFRGLKVVGIDSPPTGFDRNPVEDERARKLMLSASPDLVIVALGCPKQETLMHRWTEQGPVPVMLGLGASLDFLARRVRRAPPAVSAVGLEWLYRLINDPVRLSRRYLVRDVRIAPILARMLLRRRKELIYCVEGDVTTDGPCRPLTSTHRIPPMRETVETTPAE